jgi:hypothetical protein
MFSTQNAPIAPCPNRTSADIRELCMQLMDTMNRIGNTLCVSEQCFQEELQELLKHYCFETCDTKHFPKEPNS